MAWTCFDRLPPVDCEDVMHLTSIKGTLPCRVGSQNLREKPPVTEPWCVLLASREDPQRPKMTAQGHSAAQRPALYNRDPLTTALRRATALTSLDQIAAVIAGPADHWRQGSLSELGILNLFVQPKHQGTAYEVLLALLMLENRISPSAAVLFLPADCIVNDEVVMTNSLASMAEWIVEEPGPVYLLGAIPEGPHDQLGYIVPWHDVMLMPTGVYEFVERPDVHRARELINAGGLWNTFIFGGSLVSLIQLFRPRFDATIAALRAALRSDDIARDLIRTYNNLKSVDFSQELLAGQTDNLKVLRLLRCGWWPLKPPTPTALARPHLHTSSQADQGTILSHPHAATQPAPL
jgi:mannose-1-phosphate guanylyltransferase